MNKIVLLILILISSTGVFACDCANDIDSVKTSFLFSDIAFKGKVIKIERIAKNDTVIDIDNNGDTTLIINIDKNAYFNYTIIVFGSYKSNYDSDTISIRGPAYTSCDVNFEINETYFVFANITSNGIYFTEYCSGNKKFNIRDEKTLIELKFK